jgi:hypothetical protein
VLAGGRSKRLHGCPVMLAMDTHRIVKRLKDAGFTDSQAETVTDILAETRVADLTHLATKADLIPVATQADVAELETKTIKWLVPLLLGQTGLIVALIKILPWTGGLPRPQRQQGA